jgi:CheY-like chemotaxis protein
MIVDDNDERLSLVNDIFTRFNDVLDVQVFNSPEDAMGAFTAEPDAFEFVLTDLEMPEAGGEKLYDRLRAFAPALAILLSAASEILSHEEAEEKGFCKPVRKPFPLADLRAALYEPLVAALN